MTQALNRHTEEIIMILAELLIAILLMLNLPHVVEIITVCVGLLSMVCGAYCLKYYYTTPSTYLRYEPEWRRGILLLIVGAVIATMKFWFTVTTSAPAVVLGLTLLAIAVFKAAVAYDARTSYRRLPLLSTFFTFVLSFCSMATPYTLYTSGQFWLCIITLFVTLLDISEIYVSESKHRESWSMQIRCWM